MLNGLKSELTPNRLEGKDVRGIYMYHGYQKALTQPNCIARAHAFHGLLTEHKKHIYDNDLILGCFRGFINVEVDEGLLEIANNYNNSFGYRHFGLNGDHACPRYDKLLEVGISGLRVEIADSMRVHRDDEARVTFLRAMDMTLDAFSVYITQYAELARAKSMTADDERKRQLAEIAQRCANIAFDKPQTFAEALQLVWFTHVAYCYEGRFAMALGRMDQYLYPFYEADKAAGRITFDQAVELCANALYKIMGIREVGGYDDVVNICIGGVTPEGGDATNELSYALLKAVHECNVPGPNLSARIHKETSLEFINACLDVIGSGLGYPAMMNDDVNVPALLERGYSLEDARNYCMVGCIENFIPGKQPPWSDGRYNVPKYIELALNEGVCMLTGKPMGVATPPASSFATFDDFMEAFKAQLDYSSQEYVAMFNNMNDGINHSNYTTPFLSVLFDDCIARGLDINCGGAVYPSAHGAGCMGIATVADCLAAIKKLVYDEKLVTMEQLVAALKADFAGYDEIRALCLNAPKYGNNNDYVDQYAVWYVDHIAELFNRFKTRDGGPFYIAIASNINNITAGMECAASPDGRKAKQAMSDAASPMYGMDKNGFTSAIQSLTKPDYTKVTCGTVVNQKFSPSIFSSPEKKRKLALAIKTYFNMGGQEMQINSVSREILADAMVNPDKYRSLVVRVSGFSAFYTSLWDEVQKDILNRTEQE